MYHIESSIVVKASLQECWEFFTNSDNLALVTPDDMKMRTIYKSGSAMYEGQIIEHEVRPLLGVPMKWTTEITKMKQGSYFIDHQLSGPYKVWHHQHHFEEVSGGTRITDILTYEMPFGPLGRLVHGVWVGRQVKAIFHHRDKVIPTLLDRV